MKPSLLTHWGWVTHICISNLTIIGSDNGLSPDWCQAIIWNNAGILSIGLLGTNFSEIWIKILTFSFKKMCWKVSSAKWRPFCLSLNVLIMLQKVLVNQHVTHPLYINCRSDNTTICQKYFHIKIQYADISFVYAGMYINIIYLWKPTMMVAEYSPIWTWFHWYSIILMKMQRKHFLFI